MPLATPGECHGGCEGLFSLNGIFKAGSFAGLITANHMWGAEWFCSLTQLLQIATPPALWPSQGWGGVGWGKMRWGGVNSHRGLFLPLCWGRGPGTGARLWGTGLGAGSRNHVKSCCCAFCRVRVGVEAREDLRIGHGGSGAAPNSAELGPLRPRFPSPALPCGRHSPNTDQQCVYAPPPRCGLHTGDVPVSPAGRLKIAAPPAGPGSPASLVRAVSAHGDGMRPSPGLQCSQEGSRQTAGPVTGDLE